MKKAICSLLAIMLSAMFVFQSSVVAYADNQPEWQDATWTQQEFNDILAENPNNIVSPLATGLILSYSIAISNSGTSLYIAGKTGCHGDVVKCGFTVVTIKRRTSSSASWTTYKTYEDLYVNNSTYVLAKTITVQSGYQYRVYCTHYAKKSLLSTQKINNSSNVLVI